MDHELGRKILMWIVENDTAHVVVLGQTSGAGSSELEMLTVFDV